MTDEEGSEVLATSLQIGPYGVSGGRGQVDDAEFASLPTHSEFERLEVHILAVQRCQLRYPQTRRIDALRYGIVSFSLDSFSWYRREVSLDLISREECHLSVLHAHEVECGRIETGDLLFFQVFEPRPDRDDVCIHRLRRQT